MQTDKEKQPFHMPSIILVLGLLVFGALIACFILEWDYFMCPQSERPFHVDFNRLRPSGRMGLIWSITGTVLIFFNLSYLIRRYLIGWHWLGSLRYWLGFHMMTGLIASMAIILHSTLIFSSPLATLAFWCLQLTTITGLSGMIFYMHFSLSIEKRQIQGHEPSPKVKCLLQTFRFLHRWLAIFLITTLLLHILVSIKFGNLWILGGRT
ncbi:MAG: hypothetical protein JXA96_16545 [Sedimentisphaerales bacterium]|nr:hypothetical protein [Sedimentisphaerales bacterium]